MADIIINNISKSFNDKKILSHISLSLPEGQFTAIMGESGCGKSTLGRIMLGLIKPDNGDVLNLPNKKAAVFQSNLLFEDFDAAANIRAVLPSDENKISDVLSRVDLSSNDKTKIKYYSGGMKRRLAIARAIAVDADFYLLDEPFKELDASTKQKVMTYVKETLSGKIVVLITHEIADAEFFNADIITLNNNKDQCK